MAQARTDIALEIASQAFMSPKSTMSWPVACRSWLILCAQMVTAYYVSATSRKGQLSCTQLAAIIPNTRILLMTAAHHSRAVEI